MFDFFRNHQKLMQGLLLLLILPGFVLFGLEGYSRFRDGDDVLASIGDFKVRSQDVDNAKRQQLARMQQMLGPAFDAKLFDTPQATQLIIDNLVRERLIDWAVRDQHLTASNEHLRDIISQIPAVQEDGKFSMERYKTLLAAQNLTPEGFEARLRFDLARQQAANPLPGTEFLPKAVQKRLVELNEAPRTVALLNFKPSEYLSKAAVTAEQIEAYYKENAGQFQLPEQADVQYVVLSPEALSGKIQVPEADARSYYQQNIAQFTEPGKRRARHILISVAKDAKEADKTAARQKAEALLAKVKADPASFAAVAKAESKDPGSAANGGDLGEFGRGAMVKPFEDAAFALKKGEISGVVQSDFGFHIIQVTEVIEDKVQPFEAVRSKIEADYRKAQSAKLFAEAAESFSNMVFDQPDSLKAVIDKFKLEPITAQHVTKSPAPATPADSPLGSPEFLNALFSEDVVKNKNNTKAITVAGKLVAGRLTRYQPASTKPLEEVKDSVKALLANQEAARLAKEAGQARLAELQKQGAQAGALSAEKSVSRASPAGVPAAVLSAIFKADAAQLPQFVGAEVGADGYVIAKVISQNALPENPTPEQQAQRLSTVRKWADALSQSQAEAAMQVLKERAKVKLHTPKHVASAS